MQISEFIRNFVTKTLILTILNQLHMKPARLLTLLCLLLTFGLVQAADTFVNLTPRPKSITTGTGDYTLPAGLTVSTAGLSNEMTAEVNKFVTALNGATGLNAKAVTAADANITVGTDASIAPEGYTLDITADGVAVKASTPAGLFYAFQTIRKILPANVMAGVKVEGTYTLPVCKIDDEPRFSYRGFMLDCGRHFFTVDEIKRIIDIMAVYKLNNFQWHLTEDQGWRIEMPQYPKLTTIGATAPDVLITDWRNSVQYWANKPYGPYFYTQDELRELVEYAAEKHINVIPEVEMPGHAAAVCTAYPEFSCQPEGAHNVWTNGGVSTDVLNVANPKVMQFAKDVIDMLADIFPSHIFHIGGDECPANNWTTNAECQALIKELGLQNVRGLQSYFTSELAKYAKENYGRTLGVWNESITAGGTDEDLMKETGATVWSWFASPSGTADSGVEKAIQLGLPVIYTTWGPYYINRMQWSNDPPAAFNGGDTFQATYNWVPYRSVNVEANKDLCLGVQGTFWTEQVSSADYVEYLALPRLLAIAEAGWTPQELKDFDDMKKRFNADAEMLDLAGYEYGHHYLYNYGKEDDDKMVLPSPNKWYRLVTKATGPRTGLCLEMLPEGSPTIGTGNAQAYRLWSATKADKGASNYDNQWFRFEEDPANPGLYAMICRACPEGSVKTTPTASSNTGRWDYDKTTKHYGFKFTPNYYGKNDNGFYYYAITSDKLTNNYLNMAAAGQNFSANVWGDPADGNGGLWDFTLEDGVPADGNSDEHPAFAPITEGQAYVITNVTPGYDPVTVTGVANGALLHSTDIWAANSWEAVKVTDNADNSRTVVLRNICNDNYIAAPGAFETRRGNYLGMTADAATAATITIYRPSADSEGLAVCANNLAIWPVGNDSPSYAGTVRAGSTMSDGGKMSFEQGALWSLTPVTVITYNCVLADGTKLATFTRSIPGETPDPVALLPEIENHKVTGTKVDGNTVTVTYERTDITVTYVCTDDHGVQVSISKVTVPVGQTYKPQAPELEFYELVKLDGDATPVTAKEDLTYNALYTSDAIPGVADIVEAVTTRDDLIDGYRYVLYDADPRGGGRNCFRYASASLAVLGSANIKNVGPEFAWQFEGSKGRFKILNLGRNLYFPAVTRAGCPALNEEGGTFSFSYDDTAAGWRIKNVNDEYYWDGNSDGTMAGWTDNGQPYHVYRFAAVPHYTVTVTGVTTTGETLYTESYVAKAGEPFAFNATKVADHAVQEITGHEHLDRLAAHTQVTVTYLYNGAVSTVEADAKATGIYDLQGRALRAAERPGIYIINGVKTRIR